MSVALTKGNTRPFIIILFWRYQLWKRIRCQVLGCKDSYHYTLMAFSKELLAFPDPFNQWLRCDSHYDCHENV